MTDQSPAYHYQVIARALEVIDAGGPALTLEDLAAQMQMSPAHFQRVFSQWVGRQPEALSAIPDAGPCAAAAGGPAHDAGHRAEAGLSGGGRLHDLFLTWEAMSPGRLCAAAGRG